MRAMILAAGRGERMRPLTDTCPKPLLNLAGKPLIARHLESLARAGIRDIVINTAWLGDQFEPALGDGNRWSVHIRYSHEGTGLETAGGIARALPLLGEAPFLVMNGDVATDWNPSDCLKAIDKMERSGADLWLLMVDNPAHHPDGDFLLDTQGRLHEQGAGTGRALTYAGIAVYRTSLFRDLDPNRPAALRPVLLQAIAAGRAIGERYAGFWADIGTPERLRDAEMALRVPPG